MVIFFRMEELLLNRYRILQKIGEGATGQVFKAFDTKIGREVAIKRIAASPTTAPRVLRELRTLANLNHPNIVTVFEFEETPLYYFIIMEYLNGPTLRDILLERGRLTVPQAVSIASQVAEALEYAHGFEIIHRDIKPENIIVLRDGRVKVTDFGIARLISRDFSEKKVVGTLGYMSPEQITGRFVDETADIFALGTVLYESLTGQNPFYAGSFRETATRIINFNPSPPSLINPEVPKELDTITLKAISKDADVRYESARAFKQALSAVTPAIPLEEVTEALGKSVSKKEVPVKKFSIWERISQQSSYLEIALLGVISSWITYYYLYYLEGDSFYPPRFKLLIILLPLIVTFLSERLTLWVLAIFFTLPFIKVSIVQALIFFLIFIFYAMLFNEFKPVYGALPFLVFLLSPIKALFAFPLVVALFLRPSYSPLVAGMGCLFLELEIIKTRPTLWPFMIPNKFLSYPHLNSDDTLFQAITKLFLPFLKEPVLLAQIIIWGLSALVLGFISKFFLKKWQGDAVGLISAAIFLWISYAWLFPLFSLPKAKIEIPLLIGVVLSGLIYAFYHFVKGILERL